MSNGIGIGILAFYGLDDLKRAVRSVQAHTRLPYTLLVFDNSEDDRVGEWLRHHAGDVAYVRSPYNVGCAVSRNAMSEWFAARGIGHFVLMDEDVEAVADGWAADMLRVFARHPDTGVVGWELVTKQMGPGYVPDKTGAVPELPGACNMYSLAAVRSTPWGGGWPNMFMYLFDSAFCFGCGLAGHKTRVVRGPCKIKHEHAHQGVRRHPRMREERERSGRVYDGLVKRYGLPARGTWKGLAC